jgi:di/tricarboxylate transporter
MLIVQISVIILALFIGYLLAKREYKKFTLVEKEQLKKELRHPILALFHLLAGIGYIIFGIGFIFNSNALQYLAFFLVGIGLIINGADLWKKDNKRGLILILLGGIIFLTTTYLALKSFWF